MLPSNADEALRGLRKASTVILCAPRSRIRSKPVACAGSGVWCCPPEQGQPGLGLALSDGVVPVCALPFTAQPLPSHRAGTSLADHPPRAARAAWPRERLGGG